MYANNSNTFNLELRSNGEQSILNISTSDNNATVLDSSESLTVPVNGEAIYVNTTKGHGVFAMAEHGSVGLHDAHHDGARRCVSIGVTARDGSILPCLGQAWVAEVLSMYKPHGLQAHSHPVYTSNCMD